MKSKSISAEMQILENLGIAVDGDVGQLSCNCNVIELLYIEHVAI